MKLSEIRKEARGALTGKWGKGVCIVLAYLVIAFSIGFITGLFGEESVVGTILSIVELIITVPLSFGFALAFLKLKRNEDIKAFGFIDLAVDNFSKAWKIAGRTLLKMILPIIVLVVVCLIYVLTNIYVFGGVIAGDLSLTLTEVEFAVQISIVIYFVLYIAAIIYMVSVLLLYSLTTYIAYDNKEKTALEVVNESVKLMKGNRWKIILLELSFVGWAILGIFTFGIGYLWLFPYMVIAEICFYERLAQPKNNEEDQVKEEPFNEGPIQEM
ncbi:MAG: DUF975 family protein [Clostridia bacterium]|nr:DUF975 family protein [Clostridia bacterium]